MNRHGLTREEWQGHLWSSFRALQERCIRDAESGGFVGEAAVEEATRVINGWTNIELIDALTT